MVLVLDTAGYYAVGEEQDDNNPTGREKMIAKQSGAFQNDIGSVFIEYTAGLGYRVFGIDYHIEDIDNSNKY